LALLYIQTKEKEGKVVRRGSVWADDEGEQLCGCVVSWDELQIPQELEKAHCFGKN
jgi:hypothetical protein